MDNRSWELLSAYFSGDISDEDKRFVEEWVSMSDDNARTFNEAKKIWSGTGVRLVYTDLNSEKLLEELRNRINDRNRRSGPLFFFKRNRTYFGIAAGLCVFIASYFFLRDTSVPEIASTDISIEATDSVETFYLPDSSKVWLNRNSKITFEQGFRVRLVRLQGEAFFSVRKDSSQFSVLTVNTRTDVTGTSFNLRESEDSVVTLSVAEGRVDFSDLDSVQGFKVSVKAREKAVFEPRKPIQHSLNDDPNFAVWREHNNPIFEEEKARPAEHMAVHYRWRKNAINQTVIEGTLANNATLAAYSRIVLEVTYTRNDGKKVTTNVSVAETVLPTKKIAYRKRLFDILSNTRSVVVKVKSAEATSQNSY